MEGITVEAARSKLLDLVAQLPPRETENIPLEDALGRVLSTELTAKTSIPPFVRLLMMVMPLYIVKDNRSLRLLPQSVRVKNMKAKFFKVKLCAS